MRSLRRRIYEGHNVFSDIQEYEFEVENFVEKFRKILGKREVGIWKRKVKDTIKFAEGILGYSMSDAGVAGDAIEESTEIVENTSESIVTTQVKLESTPEETFQVKSIVPEVQEVFEAAQYQESLTEKFPNLPDITDEFFVCQNSVDLDIETRLFKLKFFRKTWCCSEPGGETEPGEMTPPVVAKVSEPKRNVAAVIDAPVYSTKEDVTDFNKWYLEQIGVLIPPTSDVCDGKEKPYKAEPGGGIQKVLDLDVNATDPMTQHQVKVELESPEQDSAIDKNPILLPMSNMYKQVDYAMSLPSSCIGNFFEGSYTINSNLNVEIMLAMFLTIIRMIYFAKPKLSFVPAMFPTQSQSLPDPSVHSCANTMGPVEGMLSRPSCQAVRQVISDVTRGYMSWLRDRVWQILQRRKIAAGLMFIQVGEMLLA